MRDPELERLLAQAKQLLEAEGSTPDRLRGELGDLLVWSASLPGVPGTVRLSDVFSTVAPQLASRALAAALRGEKLESDASSLREQLDGRTDQGEDVVQVCSDLRSLANEAGGLAQLHRGVVRLVDVPVGPTAG